MSRSSKPRLALLLAALLSAAAVGAFLPLLRNGFIRYDDPVYVTQNPHVLSGLTWANVQWAFTTLEGGNWHPLTWISHMVDVTVFGLRPGWHHLVSLGFHIANAVLLFLLLRRLTKSDGRSFFVAGLFALHPLHVESVAWVAERKDVLSTLFFMLTLWAYASWVQAGGGANAKAQIAEVSSQAPKDSHAQRYYWLALGFFIFGLLSKPMVVTLPFVLLLLDFWPLQRVERAGPGRWSEWLPLWREKVPFFGVALASSAVTFLAQREAHAVTLNLPLGARLANGVASYFKYVGKTVWPVELAIFYPHPATRYPASDQWPGWAIGLAAVALGGSVVWAIARRRSARWFTTGWLWYLGTLVPVIGIVQAGLQGMADRYSYIPSIGLFICVIWAAAELVEAGGKRWVLGSAGAAVLVVCAALTLKQTTYWLNDMTVFEHALAVEPKNAVAQDHIGIALGEQGKFEEATEHFRAALEADPNSADAYFGLGVTLEHQGQPARAMAEYRNAIRVRPWFEPAHSRLGTLLWAQGEKEAALAEYETAVRQAPEDLETRYRLALGLQEMGAWERAAAQFAYVARARPDFGHALDGATETLLRAGQLAPAEALLREVLAGQPGNATAHINLGNVLWQRGRAKEAVEEYRAALRFDPSSAVAHFNLGTALSFAGKPAEAVAEFAAAVRARPDYLEARVNLGRMLAGEDRFEEAAKEFEEAVRQSPTNANLRLDLASALKFSGRTNQAATAYAEALKLDPSLPQVLARSAEALQAQGQREAAMARLATALALKPDAGWYVRLAQLQKANDPKAAALAYREALDLKPDWPPALMNLAWLLATDSRAEVRNGPEAVRLAERAAQLSGDKDAGSWAVLGAAYAEAGDFNRAMEMVEKGRQVAISAGQTNALAVLEAGLAAYKQRKPYRQ